MKATGIVRKVDELGRIVLPKSLRKSLEIDEKDPLEMFVEEDGSIVLQKYEPQCIFCGSTKDVAEYKGKDICSACLEELKR